MRDIKFRLWIYGKMFYDIENTFECLKQQVAFDNPKMKSIVRYNHIGEHNAVFMQYTGLKDKNGKEIFEGDVVKKVIWPDKEEYIEHVEDITRHNLWINELNNEPEAYLEVIGNLYENPELIRGE